MLIGMAARKGERRRPQQDGRDRFQQADRRHGGPLRWTILLLAVAREHDGTELRRPLVVAVHESQCRAFGYRSACAGLEMRLLLAGDQLDAAGVESHYSRTWQLGLGRARTRTDEQRPDLHRVITASRGSLHDLPRVQAGRQQGVLGCWREAVAGADAIAEADRLACRRLLIAELPRDRRHHRERSKDSPTEQTPSRHGHSHVPPLKKELIATVGYNL